MKDLTFILLLVIGFGYSYTTTPRYKMSQEDTSVNLLEYCRRAIGEWQPLDGITAIS
jgi:hypothetical protein